MSCHVIIGKGNLGVDLHAVLNARGHKAHIFTPSDGFTWPDSLPALLALTPTYVWVTAGAGSVEAVKKDFVGAINTHLMFPVELVKDLPPGIKIGLFSSDYVADESDPSNPHKITPKPRSLYAYTKIWMEQAIKALGRPNVSVFRVSNLYGGHFPERTFPGKLKSRYPHPCEIVLPQNWVVPTWTKWVAEVLVDNLDKVFDDKTPLIHHAAPNGGCTVIQWGRRVVGEKYKLISKGFDNDRALFSKLSCSFARAPEWDELWARYQSELDATEDPEGGLSPRDLDVGL